MFSSETTGFSSVRFQIMVGLALSACAGLGLWVRAAADEPSSDGNTHTVGVSSDSRRADGGGDSSAALHEAQQYALEQEALTAFQVGDGRFFSLQAPDAFGMPMSVTVPVNDESFVLNLRPYSVRSPHYRLLVQDEQGALVDAEPGPVRTVRGSIEGIEGSVVGGSLLENGLMACLVFPDGPTFWIEPVASRVPAAAADLHLIYEQADVLPHGGLCGVTAMNPDETEEAVGGPRAGDVCGATYCTAQLLCDADVDYFHRYGTVAATEARIQSVINSMNVQYERDVGITHVISAIVVRTIEPDPYSTSNPELLLGQFSSYWNNNNPNGIVHDVAELFTGKNIDGSVIGIAYLSGVCGGGGYNVVQTDFNSNFASATDLSAHELGHNWSADHCSCANPSYTMNAYITSSNRFNPSITIPRIVGFRNTRTCLSPDESGMALFPFSDDFAGSIDPAKWTGVEGAVIGTEGNGEPSPPDSLNLSGTAGGGAQIRSAVIDMSAAGNIVLSYAWQRTGSGNSPEAGEDLVIEFLGVGFQWNEVARYPGDGPDNDPFAAASHSLPASAQHPNFRVRFRCISSNAGADNWFVDDVTITADDAGPPSPNPMGFAALPALVNNGTEIAMTAMQAAEINSPPVEYYFTATGDAGADDSGWQSSRDYTDDGMQPNSQYTYTVKARDSAPALNETTPSAPSTVTTAIETPTGVVFGQVTENSIQLSAAGTFTNLGTGQTAFLFDSLDPYGDVGLRQWIPTNVDTSVFLSPDTSYPYQVKARNRSGVETPWGPTASKATLAAVPEAPSLGAADCTSMGLNFVTGANPPITTYAIRCAGSSPADVDWTGMYVSAAGQPTADAVFQTQAQWGVVALVEMLPGTMYSFEVIARNQEGVTTVAGPSSSLSTVACVFGNGDMDEDGDIDLVDFAVFQNCFGGSSGDPGCLQGDLNGDDIIDLTDFAAFDLVLGAR